jgi:starch-binding outer membrane protein, SusD/RagB family
MNKHKIIYLSFILGASLMGCKKQLNVGNPNAATIPQDVTDQTGMLAFAQGAVYINGFASSNAYNWLGSSYFSLNYGFSELDADMVSSDDANEAVNTINIPVYTILDDNSKFPATPNSPQGTTLRVSNNRSSTAAGYNPFYYQWANMYILNGACNTALSIIPTIKYTGDTATVANTIRAWCYFWKGYAYSVIGSQYYAGLIVNTAGATNNNYLIRDSIIAESNKWFNLALTTLGQIPAGSPDYTTALTGLLPAFCAGSPHGGILTPTMWEHNINTMLARNILVNKLAPFVNGNLNASITGSTVGTMSNSDWQNVLTLATNGIQNGDYVFTGVSVPENGFFSASSGTASMLTAGPNTNTVFKATLRFIQDFNPGDQRLALDFNTNTNYFTDFFSTPYSLIDGPNGSNTVYNYGDQTVGAYELFIAGSWEENTLMLAEANLRLGNTNTGLQFIDAVRNYQGAGVAAVAGTGLTPAQAYQELVKERRVALFDRGLSFWDSRRWGWTYDISKGGGSYGNMMVFIPASGPPQTNVNVTFDYNFIDYWDVPADEIDLNPPSSATAKIVMNPNF